MNLFVIARAMLAEGAARVYLSPMCTIVILRRPGGGWPLVMAANRDEMLDRPWTPPGRHWSDRVEVVAGRDELAGGTWLGINASGVVAGVLNRRHSLGPAEGFRSRGELPLEALDHSDAADAATALADLDPAAYRAFNMVIADNRDAFWLRHAGNARIEALPIPPGLSMITASDRNDKTSARIRTYLPRFERARPPSPEEADWDAAWGDWAHLMASRIFDPDEGPGGAMTIVTEDGFGTTSSSLVALPAAGRDGVKPVWWFAAGRPDEAVYEPVAV